MSGVGKRGRLADPVGMAPQAPLAEEALDVPSPLACGSGHPVVPGSKFCGECGQPLASSAPLTDLRPAAAAQYPELRSPPDPRPRPEAELTDEERAERQRQHLLAMEAGRRDPGVEFASPPPNRETVLIHMVEDGLTAFGVVWFRGQELEIEVNGPRWGEARKWILLDDSQQMARWKRIMFRRGPWPGMRSYRGAQFMPMKALSGDGSLAPVGPDALMQADMAEARRGRGIPVLPRA
jgi:hypothetical protein